MSPPQRSLADLVVRTWLASTAVMISSMAAVVVFGPSRLEIVVGLGATTLTLLLSIAAICLCATTKNPYLVPKGVGWIIAWVVVLVAAATLKSRMG